MIRYVRVIIKVLGFINTENSAQFMLRKKPKMVMKWQLIEHPNLFILLCW